mgnify:CR=1 FL=1
MDIWLIFLAFGLSLIIVSLFPFKIEARANSRLRLMIITLSLIIALFTTWGTFKIFPAITDAPNVVTVFAGVFGVIAALIGLYKLLT